jgi:integrase
MLALYVLLLGETGMRCESEALHLTWADVRLDDGFVWVPQRDGHRTKGGKGRWTPMTPQLATAMRSHFARYRFVKYKVVSVPWIFHHDHTSRTYEAGQRIGSLRGSFHRAARLAKLPRSSGHTISGIGA